MGGRAWSQEELIRLEELTESARHGSQEAEPVGKCGLS